MKLTTSCAVICLINALTCMTGPSSIAHGKPLPGYLTKTKRYMTDQPNRLSRYLDEEESLEENDLIEEVSGEMAHQNEAREIMTHQKKVRRENDLIEEGSGEMFQQKKVRGIMTHQKNARDENDLIEEGSGRNDLFEDDSEDMDDQKKVRGIMTHQKKVRGETDPSDVMGDAFLEF